MSQRSSRNGTRMPPGLMPVVGIIGLLGVTFYLQEIGFFEKNQPTPGEPAIPVDASSPNPEPVIPRQFADLQRAYAGIPALQDRMTLQLSYTQSGQNVAVQGTADMDWRGADGLRLVVEQGEQQVSLAIRERVGTAAVQNPAIHDFDQQIVRREFQGNVTVGELFALTQLVDPASPQTQQSLLNWIPVPLTISPLAIVLRDPSWTRFVQSVTAVESLDSIDLEGRLAERFRAATPQGVFVFYVDPSSRLLRGIDYPPPPELPKEALQVVATARFAPHIPAPDEQMLLADLELPENPKRVRYFVVPFLETAPRHLGSRAGSLWFTDLRSQRLDSAAWDGKLAVMLWFANHSTSRLVVQEIEETLQRDGRDNIAWIAINTDLPTVLSDAALKDLSAEWGISGEVVRDLEARGRDALAIERAPTLVVIDKVGVIQLWEEGGSPALDQGLSAVIKQCREGANLAGDFVEFVRRGQDAYEQALRAAAE